MRVLRRSPTMRRPKAMMEQPPDLTPPQLPSQAPLQPADESDLAEPEAPALPPWVPVAIGVILVAFAALAVFTGLRYHDDATILAHEHPHPTNTFAVPPGEPGAGASLVLHGESGDNTPAANT